MKPKILIADDQVQLANAIKMILEAEGYSAKTAANGKQAIEKMKDEVPDLLLLDLMMPEMNGFEVLENMKLNKKLQKVPVIVVSALAQEKNIKKAYDLGASDYLIKDFEPTELMNRIKNIV